jgi:hypothetical protein
MKARSSLNILIMLFAIITISGCIYSSHYGIENRSAYAQQPINATQPLPEPIGVRIVSPIANQTIPVGELNISGTSTDTATTDCNVYVDVNDLRPLQNTTAAGPGGQNDYSNWTFTYTKKYHLITEGKNELTAKVSCNGNSLLNNTSNPSSVQSKWYSINVTGMAVQTPAEKSQNENQTQSSYANQQNVTLSDEHGPETLDVTTQPPPSKNTQEQKIADLNEKELETGSQEDQNSQDNIPVQIESKMQDKSTIPYSFNAPMDQGDETGFSSQQLMPSSDPVRTEYALSNKEQPFIGGSTEQSEIQPPLQMFELPNEGQAGTQVADEDFQDIDLGYYDPYPHAPMLQSQEPDQPIQLEPDQQPQMQPPKHIIDISNQAHETDDGQDVSKTGDDDDEAGSAEEIFSMITGQENDLQDTVDEQDVIKTGDDDDEAGSAEEYPP